MIGTEAFVLFLAFGLGVGSVVAIAGWLMDGIGDPSETDRENDPEGPAKSVDIGGLPVCTDVAVCRMLSVLLEDAIAGMEVEEELVGMKVKVDLANKF